MNFISLKNKDSSTIIKDVILHPLKINQDETGGILVETLRTDWKDIFGPKREFSMQYYSVTPPGIARDEKVWHCHPTYQEDRFIVIKGEIVVAVCDKRENSETFNLLNLFYMKPDDDPYILLIPVNSLHGFLVSEKEEGILLNFPTGIYNFNEEKRIPHKEAKVKFSDGRKFTWDIVRQELSLL